MATDYDSPRKTDDDLTEDSLQELQARRMDKSSSTIDLDPDDVAHVFQSSMAVKSWQDFRGPR